MCLYPKLILNKKYLPTKKNGYTPKICTDLRMRYVPVGCGNCIECRKQKAREWQVRIHEEFKVNHNAKFVTLSFSNEELQKLCDELKEKECNAIATIAVRRFCERWRKKFKKSVRHWLITELGHENTERIHLHGIIWTNADKDTINQIWKYGNIYVGEYCNEKTVNYIVKYVTKIDTEHKGYKSIILCSSGIGGAFTKKPQSRQHIFKEKETRDYYILDSGSRVNMPIYYRNKLYTEEEREKLWGQRLDRQERFVRGIRIDISTEQGYDTYWKVLKEAQRNNIALGYGSDTNEWKQHDYNITLNMLQKAQKQYKMRKNNTTNN